MAQETLQEQEAREKLEALYQAGEDWPLAVLGLVRDRSWLEDLEFMWSSLCKLFPEWESAGPDRMVMHIEDLLVQKEGVGEA